MVPESGIARMLRPLAAVTFVPWHGPDALIRSCGRRGNGVGGMVDAVPQRPTRRGVVRRERLLQRLTDTPDGVPLILVVAPPGYGKATLMDQWAEVNEHAFAKVAVDAADTDPSVCSARWSWPCTTSAGERWTLRAVTAGPASTRSALLARLSEELPGRSRRFVLVVDDVQDLSSAGLGALLDLVGSVPPGSHLALVTRHRISLGRFRAGQRFTEIGTSELAFTESEAEKFLQQLGLRWSPSRSTSSSSAPRAGPRASTWPG